MRFSALAAALIFSAFGGGIASAGDKVRAQMFLAENIQPPTQAQLAPDHLRHRLHEVFGFKHYVLVKEQDFHMHDEWEQWFMPRHDFFLRVEPLHHDPGQPHLLDYEIYKDGFIVAKGRYEPRLEEPLFINGPDFRQGRLVFVLEPRDED
jgi:hypothetical protein